MAQFPLNETGWKKPEVAARLARRLTAKQSLDAALMGAGVWSRRSIGEGLSGVKREGIEVDYG
jgi:hypothetical protein